MTAALLCDLEFHGPNCTNACLTPTFDEFNNSYLTDGATLTRLNTSTHYIFWSSPLYSPCTVGRIAQMGIAVDETTSNGTHTIELRYFRNSNDQFEYLDMHTLTVNIQGPGIYTLNLSLLNRFQTTHYGIRSSSIRLLTYPNVGGPTYVWSSTALPYSNIPTSQLQIVSGRILFFMKYQTLRTYTLQK